MANPSGVNLDTGGPRALEIISPDWDELGTDWEPLEVGAYEPLEIDWSWLDIEPDFTEARAVYTELDYPEPPGPGRKGPRLSEPRVQQFLEALEGGLFVVGAAAWAGIGERTARRWVARGKTDEASETPSTYRQLWQAAQVAEVIAIHRALVVINKAVRAGDWRAAAWLLEHRYPERWGNPSPPRPGPAQRARMAQAQKGKR